MKTEEQIQEQLKFAKDQLADAQEKYTGDPDNIYPELIHKMKGEIIALEWVLDDER